LLAESLDFAAMLSRSRENRKSERRFMRRDAQVIFGAHEQPIRCVIQDLSDGGARLCLNAIFSDVPRTFTLVLFKDGIQRNCELVWMDGRVLGVKFISQWCGTQSSGNLPVAKVSRKGAA
jgi:hypothetical protein